MAFCEPVSRLPPGAPCLPFPSEVILGRHKFQSMLVLVWGEGEERGQDTSQHPCHRFGNESQVSVVNVSIFPSDPNGDPLSMWPYVADSPFMGENQDSVLPLPQESVAIDARLALRITSSSEWSNSGGTLTPISHIVTQESSDRNADRI